ncbi:MAG TPA: uroporphyrinogen-III synthase [Gammaproteobacteria bacterium]
MSDPAAAVPVLEGARVAVTRPRHQCQGILRMLEAGNAYAMCLPVIDILPVADSAAAVAALRARAGFDLLVFTSANVVSVLLEHHPEGASLADGATVAAVGPATRRALESAGIPVSVLPADDFSSEGLLRHAALQAEQIAGKRVLLLKGAGGRPLLAESLAERGAKVASLDVYRRACPAGKIRHLLGEPLEGFGSIVITSGTALEHLLLLANDQEKRHALGAQLVVSSPRIARLARQRGALIEPVVSATPADEAIVDALADWWSARNRSTKTMEHRRS